MKQDTAHKLPHDLDEGGSRSAGKRSDQDGLSRLAGLQTELFDLIVKSGVSDEPLNAIVRYIRDSFSADGAIVVYPSKEADGLISKSACWTDGVQQVVVDRFITTDEPIPLFGDLAGIRCPDGSGQKLPTGNFWAETFLDTEQKMVQGHIILLFESERNPTPKDRLALKAISPLVRHISDTVESRDALKSANDKLASLTSTIPGVVYQRVVTPDGDIRYTYVSESAQDLFGVSAQEIVNNPRALFGIFAPEYAEGFRDRLIAASKALSVWDVEASFVTKDGELKYTHAIATPQQQDDGSVLWTGVILDATRIKQEADSAAAETEARTRETIVESLSQGFLLFDSDDKLVMRNSHFSTFFPDLDDVVVVGATYSDVLHAEMGSGLDAAQRSFSLSSRVAERLAMRESKAGYAIERQLSDDCWILIKEHRSSDGTVLLYTDVSEIKQREKRIRHMAHHDALTGLPNRVLFQSRVKDAIAQAQSNGTKVAVAFLDLDHFKNVNDTLGHPAGDVLLCTVAKRIQRQVREADTVARLGGDEFAIVLTDFENPDIVKRAANDILKSLALPIKIQGQQTITGASMGIALLSPETKTPEQLLKNADLALYRAKSEGRNNYRFFEPEMDEKALARRKIEFDLRLALEKNEFELYFQPLVNMGENKIAGFESLIRWNHPELGLVPPDDFIGIAEETGLIVPLGEWILKTACKAAADWSEPVKVAVNVSPAQFKQSGLVEAVFETLEQSSLDPGRLELEITESVLMQNSAETMDTLYRLKGLGVRIAMDDFGTGYSSLGNLRSFPFDKIKIDKSFVCDIETNNEAAAIVRAVVGLAHSLGIQTTAEGVETRDQLAYLRIEGCSEAQGYYYSKPRPGSEVCELLKLGPDGMELSGTQPGV